MREKRTTITLRENDIDQQTTQVSMALSVRDYDNGRTNNLKTETMLFYTISRQRDMGEYVTLGFHHMDAKDPSARLLLDKDKPRGSEPSNSFQK